MIGEKLESEREIDLTPRRDAINVNDFTCYKCCVVFVVAVYLFEI